MELEEQVAELINRRRNQVLIHSVIYYRFGESVISDKEFDSWAYQLSALQEQYPEIAEKCVYAEAFRDFDGTTGYHLPMYDDALLRRAEHLLSLNRVYEEGSD